MGVPVASGTLAGSTSGSAASMHREAARSDFTRSVATVRSHNSHNSADVAESNVVVGHDFRDRERK